MNSRFENLSTRVADFFDRPLEAAFGKTRDGHDVVYLWPWKHDGYILPNAECAQQMRATMGWWIHMALPIFVLFAALGVHALISFGALYMAGYYVTALNHLHRLAPAAKEVQQVASED
jgi:hypothetical protein